jgi:hypothetical protein
MFGVQDNETLMLPKVVIKLLEHYELLLQAIDWLR